MNLEEFFNHIVTFVKHLLAPCGILRLNISKTCELVKMSSKCISRTLYCLIPSTHKTSSFYKIMPAIKCGSSKILINWMNLEVFKRVYWSYRMLPYISDYIVKVSSLKVIYGIRRKPIFHIQIPGFSVVPLGVVSW